MSKSAKAFYIFQQARRLAAEIWTITQKGPFSGDRVLTNHFGALAYLLFLISPKDSSEVAGKIWAFLKDCEGFLRGSQGPDAFASDLNYISKRECEEFCLATCRT